MSQATVMLRLEEPRIGQPLEDTQLVITVQLKILNRKIIQFSDGELVLHLIQNFKVRRMYNNN